MRGVHDRLSLRWYLGYDLHEPLPDHSTVTRIRERYRLEVFRLFFDSIVERCIDAGLVWGEELYFDATRVQANASLVEAYLEGLFGDEGDDTDRDQHPPTQLPTALDETARERLAEGNAGRHDWIAEEGRQDRDATRGHYRRIADFHASRIDPDATPMRSDRGLDHAYHTHYAVDGGKARIVLACVLTPSEVMEN